MNMGHSDGLKPSLILLIVGLAMFLLSFLAGVAMFFVPEMMEIAGLGPWSILIPGLIGIGGFVLALVGGVALLAAKGRSNS